MPGCVDRALIEEILGGDPVLTPAEAAAQLGIDEDEVLVRARAGVLGSVQVIPDTLHARGVRRFRQSVITACLAETGAR
jgi:hypothetical protein